MSDIPRHQRDPQDEYPSETATEARDRVEAEQKQQTSSINFYRQEIERNKQLIKWTTLLELIDIADFQIGVPHSGHPITINFKAKPGFMLGDGNYPFVGLQLEEFLRAEMKELFKAHICGMIRKLEAK